jgi:hypothetical protein
LDPHHAGPPVEPGHRKRFGGQACGEQRGGELAAPAGHVEQAYAAVRGVPAQVGSPVTSARKLAVVLGGEGIERLHLGPARLAPVVETALCGIG